MIIGFQGNVPAHAALQTPPCEKPGWFPTTFGLKDHSIFWYDGYYYLVSIFLPSNNRFAYGRSVDLCQWEDLSPVLSTGLAGKWDEMAIWAPFVLEQDEVYYMFYTGVTYQFTQSILLATSRNPEDPMSWQYKGVVFQPDHEGMLWQVGQWSDCRDPMVIKIGTIFYMYYSASDVGGGVVGLAVASRPEGPWVDRGAITTPFEGTVPESSTMVEYSGYDYLFFNHPGFGSSYLIGFSPLGPWRPPLPLGVGWAHEVWKDQNGAFYTSYLTNYSVSISPLTWDTYYNPPRPFIGSEVHHLLLPYISR